MSASSAIGLVSQALQTMLAKEFKLTPVPAVTILAPDEPGDSPRLNLFLFRLEENAPLKNLDWQIQPGTTQLTPPPLSLNLFYLMTAYAANDPNTQSSTAQVILGEGMRIFYEGAIVPDTYLSPGLKDAREQVRIMLCSASMQELSFIWATTFQKPYRLSAVYEVSVVQIDKSPASMSLMAPRVKTVGTPTVEAPYTPPVVEAMQPINGPVGTTVTFRGSNIAGWYAYVTVGGQSVLNKASITGDSFTIQIPVGLLTGFYEVTVDISHLFRSTYFFEVTG